MTRPRPSASRSWMRSWLLVVLTVAGLVFGEGGHCAAELSVDVTAGGPALSVNAPTVGAAAGAGTVTASADRHEEGRALTLGGGPSTSADSCRFLPVTAASTNAAAAVSAPPDGRTVAAASPACLVKQRALPGATLAYLGVSRT